jgi:hypothetical protein
MSAFQGTLLYIVASLCGWLVGGLVLWAVLLLG